jgi:hypothetical protein
MFRKAVLLLLCKYTKPALDSSRVASPPSPLNVTAWPSGTETLTPDSAVREALPSDARSSVALPESLSNVVEPLAPSVSIEAPPLPTKVVVPLSSSVMDARLPSVVNVISGPVIATAPWSVTVNLEVPVASCRKR